MKESKINFVTSDSPRQALLWARLLAFFYRNKRLIVVDRSLDWFDDRGRIAMDAILNEPYSFICCIRGDVAIQLQQWWREINIQEWEGGQISWWHIIPPELDRWQEWQNWRQEWCYFHCYCLGDLDRGSSREWKTMPQMTYFPKLWLPEKDWQAWENYNGDFKEATGRFSSVSPQSRQRIINWLQTVFKSIETATNTQKLSKECDLISF